jgi:outer membrane receptor protein involved in Fe transport
MEDGSPISKVSDHKINAGLSLTLKKLTLTPRIRWVSDIRKIPSPGFDTSESMDGHFVFDLSLRASNLFRNVDLYLTGVNLFNAAYFAAAPYGEGPSGWVMDKAPQPGLSIVAGLRIRL